MRKILFIAWKDLIIQFRDRNALLLMLVAPLILAGIIGAAFGDFLLGGQTTPIQNIPVIFVNEDAGAMGEIFRQALLQNGLDELLSVTEMADSDAARTAVQQGEARAAVIVPPGFSEALQGASQGLEVTAVALYADPAATITPNIVRGVVGQIMNEFNREQIETILVASQLQEAAAASEGEAISGDVVSAAGGQTHVAVPVINLKRIEVGDAVAARPISPFAFFAPSMGILFLMFAMMNTTRSILEEEQAGTLTRLLGAPISSTQLMLGKVGGVFFAGIIQFVIFVIASRLLFQLDWGRSLSGLALMVLAIVAAYTGLGMVIATFARDNNQAAIIGSVIALIFAALGGNFVAAQNFPPWLDTLSKITINRWGLDGLIELTINGGVLADVLLEAGVLLGLGIVFFALAVTQFNRRVAR